MKWTVWMMSVSLLGSMLMVGHAVSGSCAERCYGPRAIYSPFQEEGREGLSSRSQMSPFAFGSQDTVEEEKPVIEEIKKPGRAFFLSALVPGWGQLYAGARTRGLVFLGIEATTVTWAILSHLKGTDRRNEYESFADQHWFEDQYLEWYQAWEDWYNYPTYALDPLDNHLTHTLPDEKDRDYYEMIGKYDQFVYGWDDVNGIDTTGLNLDPFDPTLAPRDTIPVYGETGLDTVYFPTYIAHVYSANRTLYMDMRYKANKAFKRAKQMVGVMLFNHVISAIDAARSARNYNVKHAELKTTLRMRMKEYEGEQIPQLVLTHRFY
jgi:hypothetical protein